jgi:hypothetical protein
VIVCRHSRTEIENNSSASSWELFLPDAKKHNYIDLPVKEK